MVYLLLCRCCLINMTNYFHLSVRPQIEELSEMILDKKELEEVDLLSEQLVHKKTQENAVNKLRELVGYRPKRPVYYVWIHLRDLPKDTRTVVFYAGSYIDCLMKHVSNEKGKNIIRALFTSLRNNIKWSKEVLGAELVDILYKYESLIYTPAKHDFDEKKGRPHLFSSKEAVSVCFMTMKLAKQLINLSEEAKNYSLNKYY